MSDKPGEYELPKLKDLLTRYFKKANYSSNRIKNVLLPALLTKKTLTRNQLKKEFVKMKEARNVNSSRSVQLSRRNVYSGPIW